MQAGAKRGSGADTHQPGGQGQQAQGPGTGQTPAERHATMTWAQRLKQVFNIDIQTCSQCGVARLVG